MTTSTIKPSTSYISGTDGIWKYRKYDDGTYHAWYERTINLDYVNTFGSALWFYVSRSALVPPSFSTSVTSLTGSPNDDQLMMYSGHSTNYKTYWVKGAQGHFLIMLALDLICMAHGKPYVIGI